MILDEIAASTVIRVAKAKENISLAVMKEQALAMKPKDFPFEKALRKSGISFICEVKKASPSKGLIAKHFPYLEIAKEYEDVGAAAISVLTEPEYFQGDNKYLQEIAKTVTLPVLRKDFTVDEYQIYEAMTLGASAILLICSLLDVKTIQRYIQICDSLGISALVEAHDLDEIQMAIEANARIIGVNNRNLKDFTVNVQNGIKLRQYVPDNILFVAESGIRTRKDVRKLEVGKVNGALIGETFMVSKNKKETMAMLRGE